MKRAQEKSKKKIRLSSIEFRSYHRVESTSKFILVVLKSFGECVSVSDGHAQAHADFTILHRVAHLYP